jgi:MFS family permease
MPGGRGTPRLPADFWLYFGGQLTSTLGSSFTQYALPLLIFQLTGSAANLGAGMAVTFLPYLLFGLVIGAISDRVDRKRMMVGTDVARALLIAVIPALSAGGVLSVGWIYAVAFVQSTLRIFFDSGEFAAIPSLVEKRQLVAANGRIQASFSAARIVGPVLAGVIASSAPVVDVLIIDAATFGASAVALLAVRRSFNEVPAKDHPGAGQRGRALLRSLLDEVAEGLRYVWRHPVLRNISVMMALINLFSTTVQAQIVFYATDQLAVSNRQLGYLYAAGGLGVVRRRGHRYDITDGGAAVSLAGKPRGWLERVEGPVATDGFNVNRRGALFVPAVAGLDIASLALRLADTSRSAYLDLLETVDG